MIYDPEYYYSGKLTRPNMAKPLTAALNGSFIFFTPGRVSG